MQTEQQNREAIGLQMANVSCPVRSLRAPHLTGILSSLSGPRTAYLNVPSLASPVRFEND